MDMNFVASKFLLSQTVFLLRKTLPTFVTTGLIYLHGVYKTLPKI